MLKLFLLGTLFLTAVLAQNTGYQSDEEALRDDEIDQQDEAALSDELDSRPESSRASNILSRSFHKKRDSFEDYDYQENESKPRKRPNNGRGKGGRTKTAKPKKHRELDREPQRKPLITRDDICYRLKLNVLRDFERYIDLYIDKCKINSI